MQKVHRKRAVLSWRPEWSTPIEKWTAYQISKNLWRFDRMDGPDDLMQQARILFWELGQKYPTVEDPRHFFALYKTSLLRRFIDKARTRQRSAIDHLVNAEDLTIEEEGVPSNAGHLSLILQEMPDELKTVLHALTSGRVRRRLDRPPVTSTRQRENHNMRLKRRFSLTLDDPVGELKNYLLNI